MITLFLKKVSLKSIKLRKKSSFVLQHKYMRECLCFNTCQMMNNYVSILTTKRGWERLQNIHNVKCQN